MSSLATQIIERAEREAGQRVDANGGDNNAIAALFGALAREVGTSSHRQHDDFVAGVLIQHRMSPAYAIEQRNDNMLANMLANMLVNGMSPEDLAAIAGTRQS